MSAIKKPLSKRKATKPSKAPDECPICYDAVETKLCFPCAHRVCAPCFKNVRLVRCPLCRMSRDGETGEEQRASEVTDREARANAAPRGVAFVRLGDAVPSGGYSSSFVTHAFVAGSGGTPMDVVALPPAAQWIHLMRPPL